MIYCRFVAFGLVFTRILESGLLACFCLLETWWLVHCISELVGRPGKFSFLFFTAPAYISSLLPFFQPDRSVPFSGLLLTSLMEGTDSRYWQDLLPDALGLIFKNLSFQEILTVIPRVCKSWSNVVMGPYCWQEIDIEDWSNRSDPGNVDRILQMLITRSSGSLRKLCVSGLQNENSFYFIAEHAHSLQTLRLPRSEMSDPVIEKIAEKISTLTFLDLSYCCKIGPRALVAIGKKCKFLSKLRRNMHPLDVEGKLSQNDEAHAIATAMPKLKHLEIAYHLVDTVGVLEIIISCHELEFLDLRGCWDVKFDEKYLKDNFPKLNVLGPHILDQYENIAWEECSDYSDSLYDYESSDGMWDDEERLELRFYEGFTEDYVYGWPPSP